MTESSRLLSRKRENNCVRLLFFPPFLSCAPFAAVCEARDRARTSRNIQSTVNFRVSYGYSVATTDSPFRPFWIYIPQLSAPFLPSFSCMLISRSLRWALRFRTMLLSSRFPRLRALFESSALPRNSIVDFLHDGDAYATQWAFLGSFSLQ